MFGRFAKSALVVESTVPLPIGKVSPPKVPASCCPLASSHMVPVSARAPIGASNNAESKTARMLLIDSAKSFS